MTKGQYLTKEKVMNEAGGDPDHAMELVAGRFAEILWDYVMWERRQKQEKENQEKEPGQDSGGLLQ